MNATHAKDETYFLARAITLARDNVQAGGRPFGAVVVHDGDIVASGVNTIHLTGDVTDHAELLAIRAAAKSHGPDVLKGSTVFASGHPCPMCLAAMRLAGISRIFYAYSNADGAPYQLSTAALYEDLQRPLSEQSMAIRHVMQADHAAPALYVQWANEQRNPKNP
jgi:guanine deaminase